MTTGTIKAVPVGDLEEQLARPPRCEVCNGTRGCNVQCTLPAVVRLKITCGCGKICFRFCCAVHLEALKAGRVHCSVPPACTRTEFAWTEA